MSERTRLWLWAAFLALVVLAACAAYPVAS